MSTRFLAIGIDHGTTNSCIAVMEDDRPYVIRPGAESATMPSAIYLDAGGRMVVGETARLAMATNKPGEGSGCMRFKPEIGQNGRYEFRPPGQVMTAPELGSIVIKELLKLYRLRNQKEPIGAVITVPAKFEDNAYAGTRKAAELAGLHHYPLLQEPLAAAMAYGFSAEDKKARWLIFDLGGGTLDISLLQVRQGKPKILEGGQAGDPQLGGRVFDDELMAYVLAVLKKRYALKNFSKNRDRLAWDKLLLAVEDAKIRLSIAGETVVTVDGELCDDERGTPVEVEVPVSRAVYEPKIAPYAERAVVLCRQLLKKNRLKPQDIDRLILVGGPTKTPYIQNILNERLGIPFDTSQDPMTIVAQGAALYATTVSVKIEDDDEEGATLGRGAKIALSYDRTTTQLTVDVDGQVVGENQPTSGWTAEIARADRLWTSGQYPVQEGGRFSCAVELPQSSGAARTRFTTTIFDSEGRIVASAAEPEIWYQMVSIAPPLASSLLVGLRDNTTEVLLPEGVELPARSKPKSFLTSKELRRGDGGDLLRVPILEAVTHWLGAEDPSANCHVLVDTLVIAGDDERVTMDLPRGSEIEVTIEHDRSRQTRARAFVPLLGCEFEASFRMETDHFETADLEQRLREIRGALGEVRDIESEFPLPDVSEGLATLEQTAAVETAEGALAQVREGQEEARTRAYREVLKLDGAVHHLRHLQRTRRLRRQIDRLAALANGEDGERLRALGEDLARAEAAGDEKGLAHIEEVLDEMNKKLRGQPYVDLLLDLMALSGLRVAPHQHALFNRASQLMDEINARGGMEGLTENDRDRLLACHRELAAAHPELGALREKIIEDLRRQGKTVADLNRGDLERSKPH